MKHNYVENVLDSAIRAVNGNNEIIFKRSYRYMKCPKLCIIERFLKFVYLIIIDPVKILVSN